MQSAFCLAATGIRCRPYDDETNPKTTQYLLYPSLPRLKCLVFFFSFAFLWRRAAVLTLHSVQLHAQACSSLDPTSSWRRFGYSIDILVEVFC